MSPNPITPSGPSVKPAPKAGIPLPLEAGAVFTQESSTPPVGLGLPEGALSLPWATDLKPSLVPRTLPTGHLLEAEPRSVPWSKALQKGLLAAGLALAPMTYADAGAATRPTPIVNVVTLQPGQSMVVAPGFKVNADDLQTDRTHHYEIAATNGALEVTRLASDATIPAEAFSTQAKIIIGVFLTALVALIGVGFDLAVLDGAIGETVLDFKDTFADKLADLKEDLAKSMKSKPSPAPSSK